MFKSNIALSIDCRNCAILWAKDEIAKLSTSLAAKIWYKPQIQLLCSNCQRQRMARLGRT